MLEKDVISINIIDELKTSCVLLDYNDTPDDKGGYHSKSRDLKSFDATIRKDKSPEDVTAQKHELSERFTVCVHRDIELKYHDIFRRESDGALFRVTSGTIDGKAPDRFHLPIAFVTAERWIE